MSFLSKTLTEVLNLPSVFDPKQLLCHGDCGPGLDGELTTKKRVNQMAGGFMFLPAAASSRVSFHLEDAWEANCRLMFGEKMSSKTSQVGHIFPNKPSPVQRHPGDVSWVLHVHIVCLNYDGNAFDLCLLAAIAALEEPPLELVTGTVIPY